MSQQVSGKRMLQKYEIEFNGNVFNCLECNKSDCCSTNNNSTASNKVACQKCRCQQLYTVKDGTRAGLESVGELGCTDCSINMTETECNSYEFLNNKIIQTMSIVDCANNVITAGTNNNVTDVSLKSACYNGNTQVHNSMQYNPTSVSIGPITTTTTVLAIGGGSIIMIIILMMLFK